jgi:hypothetical protein
MVRGEGLIRQHSLQQQAYEQIFKDDVKGFASTSDILFHG